MANAPPRELTELLEAAESASEERAWQAFVERYSRAILETTRTFAPDYDGSMDRYRFVLEELRRDGYRRLRAYHADSRSRFTTWLAVVARRLCIDYHRKRYGRDAPGQAVRHSRQVRRRLADLVAEELDPGVVADTSSDDPEHQMRRTELSEALASALERLNPEERLLLKLRFEDDKAVREIARAMRYPTVFHVYRRLNPLLASLRTGLEAKGVYAPEP